MPEIPILGSFDILKPVWAIYSETLKPFLQFFLTFNAVKVVGQYTKQSDPDTSTKSSSYIEMFLWINLQVFIKFFSVDVLADFLMAMTKFPTKDA